MKLERERGGVGPIVKGFAAGGFRLDEGVFLALLLTPTRADGWTPPPLAVLAIDDIQPLLDPVPEFVMIGTGAALVRPPLALTRALEERGIGLEAMDSRAAARAWSVLRGEGRAIAAALYPLDA
jgi:uncharacterized protein